MTSLYDFSATRLTGEEESLRAYTGQVAVVVNTASQCGFTPQLAGLQALYQRYADQGLVVLGFPCNQFAHQDPGTDTEIGAFCEQNFGVQFPMFAKVEVNGPDAHPLFQWLRTEKGGLLGNAIKWNFTKFLVSRTGAVIRRYPPTTPPEKMVDDLERALGSVAA